MPILRQYVMIAAVGREDALCKALIELAAKVRPIEGCEDVELYQDAARPAYFVFIERWVSIDIHKAAARQLGKEALADVLAVLMQPPEGRYLEPIAL